MDEPSTELLLEQLEKALMKFGHADALGVGRRKAEAKSTVNRLVKLLRDRGVDYGYVREIE